MASNSTNSTVASQFEQINKSINSSINLLNSTNSAFAKNQTTIIQNIVQIQKSSDSLENYIEALVNNTNAIKAEMREKDLNLTKQIKELTDQVVFLSNTIASLTNLTNTLLNFTASDMYYLHTSIQIMGSNFVDVNSTNIV
jgi:predicted  nucleic acid-binding Zn-ribbon protein